MSEILVLGLGRPALGDDGFGAAVVAELQRRLATAEATVPPGTVVEATTDCGPGALERLATARRLLLVDALGRATLDGPGAAHGRAAGDGGTPAGELRLVEMNELLAASADWASEPDGPLTLVAMARLAGVLPPDVTLLGAEAATFEPSTCLSIPVERAVGPAVDLVLGWLRAPARSSDPLEAAG